MDGVIPPPPGFQLDAPTGAPAPPSGFKLDTPAAVPASIPPPPGFKIDPPSAAPGIVDRTKRLAGEYASDIKDQFTKPFQKDTSSGPELLQRIGDIGSRIGSVPTDAIRAIASPVQASIEAGASAAVPPVAKALEGAINDPRFKVANITPEKQEAVARDIGDIGSQAALMPGKMPEAAFVKGAKVPAVAAAKPAIESGLEAKMADLERQLDSGAKNPEEIKAQMGVLADQRIAELSGKKPIISDKSAPRISPIFTDDKVPVASTEPVTTAPGHADRLYQLNTQVTADEVEAEKWLKSLPETTPEQQAKFHAYSDDPKNNPLTPEEKTVYDNSIRVLKNEQVEPLKEMGKLGITPKVIEDQIGGASRQVVGKGGPLDRLLGIKPPKAPSGGRSLSKTPGSAKSRSMFAITHDDDSRQIVHVRDDGEVVDAETFEPLGNKDDLKLGEATQAEIERATGGGIEYHKNALGVEMTKTLELRKAARIVRYLEDMKKDPNFSGIATAPGTKGANIPNGWKEIPELPLYRGYHFDPKHAEVIEDFLKRKGSSTDPVTDRIEKTGRFLTAALFWVNPIHTFNLGNMFLVTKGAGGLVRGIPRTVKNFAKATVSVLNRDKTHMQLTRAGVANRGLDAAGRHMADTLIKTMGESARSDPKTFLQMMKTFGYDSPKAFLTKVNDISHRITFDFGDILQQTLIRDLTDKGIPLSKAREEIAKTFSDYRVPSRVLDSRGLGKSMQGPLIFRFPGYTYGLLKGLGTIIKGTARGDLHSADQLLAVGLLSLYGSYAADKVIQNLTGNSQASAGRSGYEKFPELARRVIAGENTVGQSVDSLGSPGYLPMLDEAMTGRNQYTGKPITVSGERPTEVGYDYLSYAMDQISPLAKAMDVASGKKGGTEALLEQLGIKDPSAQEQLGKQRAIKYNNRALKAKRKKEPDILRP